MKLRNLGDGSSIVSFEEALRRGIAHDGSLYYPMTIPTFTAEEIASLPKLTEKEIAYLTLEKWLSDEISPEKLQAIVDQASIFPVPVKQVGDKYILEMFHGPTMAFKDVAARYLAALMSHFNKGSKSTVLVATSGDTGGAIAHGFGGLENVQVVVLFPKGRVSELQYEQLTRVESNIIPLEIDGSFDDCQALVKEAFSDAVLSEKLGLTSANSISIGRLLPQVTYYVQTYAKLPRTDLRVTVPTGNLGNLTAGLIAWKMGIPFQGFISANNANDAVTRYLETEIYEPRESIATMSNAMDVGAPNNLPRFVELFSKDVEQARKMVKATMVSDSLTVKTMSDVYENHLYILDPHTAVGWAASEQLRAEHAQDVVVATASPVKFSREIASATGIEVLNANDMKKLQEKPARVTSINADYDSFKAELEKL